MIASQKIGKSFMGALRYNTNKLWDTRPEKRAELLATNFSSVNLKEIGREVEWLRQLRPNLNRYVYHTSLNFSPTEAAGLTNEKLLAIGQDYLQAMGYTNNQFLIFRHHDAEHPHLHLLANRICFDGSVVSDSNNYEKSEAIVRSLEKQYGLSTVIDSKQAVNKAPKKDEIEMSLRTGQPSTKRLLQHLLTDLLQDSGSSNRNSNRKTSFSQFIRQGEALGIHFLFNQASTGRVTGITYQYQDFKITGKALGKRYKWGELIKQLDYEQKRDRKSVSDANGRTAKAWQGNATDRPGIRSGRTGTSGKGGARNADQYVTPCAAELTGKPQTDGRFGKQSADAFTGDKGAETKNSESAAGWAEKAPETIVPDGRDRSSTDLTIYSSTDIEIYSSTDIQITNDIDDEAIKGRNRQRKKQVRTNRR